MDAIVTGLSAFDSGKWNPTLQGGKVDQRTQIDQAAKQFEGILLRQFLDEALKTADGSGGMLGSSIPMYDHIIKDTLANSISQGTSLGLSSVLQAQLGNDSDDLTQKTNTK
jgi:Rod binding domain-containing protein